MKSSMKWYDYLTINSYSFGTSLASGILTPLLIPYLILIFFPPEQKNTYYAIIRVVGLAIAMFVQPLMGMLSDRSTLRWGRRRPFIVISATFNVIFLAIIGLSPSFKEAGSSLFGWPLAFVVLMAGSVLMQFSSNIGQAALQGLIPDLVPEQQRGRASGVKSVFDLLPSLVIALAGIGAMVDRGNTWGVIAIIMFGYASMALVTVLFVKEEPLKERPGGRIGEAALRMLALTAIFVGISQAAVWLVTAAGQALARQGASAFVQVAVVGIAGLAAIAGSIFAGVYLGAWVGIGSEAPRQRGFIWWVINRLMFLAAIGSIQSFALYYLRDVVKVENPGQITTLLMGAVAIFLIISALVSGYLADRFGRRRLVAAGGFVGAAGTLLLLLTNNVALIMVSGCILGLGTGTFMATNWALGTDLVPKQDAGKYLGISNLAGAGAGIVGAGIGGPLADFFNTVSPGLGYPVIYSIYGLLFLLSVVALTRIKTQ